MEQSQFHSRLCQMEYSLPVKKASTKVIVAKTGNYSKTFGCQGEKWISGIARSILRLSSSKYEGRRVPLYQKLIQSHLRYLLQLHQSNVR